jgi:hypothetical protein
MRIAAFAAAALVLTALATAPLGAATIDHLVLGVGNLEAGVAQFRELTGVEPVFGGKHPSGGTQNALASLGGGTYLEIIAPVPGEKLDPRFARLAGLEQLTPLTWAVGVADAAALVPELQALGHKALGPFPGSRVKPDGQVLEWNIVAIESTNPALPFFIQWKAGTAHPSATSPGGCTLDALKLHDADPATLKKLADRLGLQIAVETAAAPGMGFSLRCPKGAVEFASSQPTP